MKNAVKIRTKRSWEREESGSAVNYVTYFFGIMIAVILFAFLMFRANLLVVESDMKTGLHIAGNSVLAIDSLEGSLDLAKKEFPNSHRKLHIVPKGCYAPSYAGTLTSSEEAQLRVIGQRLETEIKEYFCLEDSEAVGTILGNLTQNGIDTGHVYFGYNDQLDSKEGFVTVYEPIYDVDVITSIHPVKGEYLDFLSDYDVTGYIVYTLQFKDNRYVACVDKEIKDTPPKLRNGQYVEGATIELALRAEIYGVNDIFTNRPENGIFGTNPEKPLYRVQVVQAVDIIPAERDSRTKQ